MEIKHLSPVFLLGCMRSGTTLLRLMLDHHPDIAFNLESEYLVTQISEDGRFPDMRDYVDFLKNDRVFQHSHFEVRENLDYVSMVNDFLEQKRTRDRKKIVGATVHFQFSKLSRIWPEARYIYLLRDGRDVANSVVRMGWAGNSYVGADWWLEVEMEWESYRRSLPAENWIELRYTDLVTRPVEQLTRICEFLGVEYSERMFDYVHGSTYEPLNPAMIEQWKRNSDRKAIQRVEAKIGDRLLARGYKLSGYPKIKISGLKDLYLRLDSAVGTLLYRVRNYGTALVIAEFLTRRLGFRKQNLRFKKMIDEIIDANLK